MSGSAMDDDRAQAIAFVEQVGNMPVGQFVPNATATRTTASEIQCVLAFGQRPMALLVLAPSVAKTLALSLLSRIEEYEALTGYPVQSISEIASRNQVAPHE